MKTTMNELHRVTLLSILLLNGCGHQEPADRAASGASPARQEADTAAFSSSGIAPSVTSAAGPLYFGYWGSAMSHTGTGNYIAETAPYSNLQFIRGDWATKLEHARIHGQHTALMMRTVLYPGGSWEPHPNWRERFDEFWEGLTHYQGYVAVFYLFDEPLWTYASSGGTAFNTVVHHLNEIAAYIKQKTQRVTALSYAYTSLKLGYPRVSNVDWIGFNCYTHEKGECSAQQVTDYFTHLLQTKQPTQKLMITADGSWKDSPPDAAAQQTVVARIDLWRRLVDSAAGEVVEVDPVFWTSS
jgi:hypothetical protein